MTEEDWVELCEVTDQAEGELIRSLLQASGIQVSYRSFLPSTVYPGLAPIKLIVLCKDLELARKILSQKDEDINYSG